MSDNFVKLYGSILDSSIWCEAAGTRLLFITMLAMADENGDVQASVGGLAKRARISREECVAGLEVLLSPDPDDRSGVEEGRRLREIQGGWHLINAKSYREKRTKDQIKAAEKVAAWRKKHREGGNSGLQELPVTDTDPNSPGYLLPMLPAEGEGEVEVEKEEKKKKPVGSLPAPSPLLLTFPCVGKVKRWGLGERQVSEWEKLYPDLDVLACCRKALAWVEATPSKRKTFGGMPRFLVGWLNRETDTRGGGSPARASVVTPTTTKASLEVARRTLTAKAFSAWTAGALTTEQRDEITNAVERARSLEDLQGIAWPSRS